MGILFLGSNLEYFRERFSAVTVPCVLVTNSAASLNFENLSSVSTDDDSGAVAAIELLISLGHCKIGILGGQMEKSMAALTRYVGGKKAFAGHGMAFEPEQYFENPDGTAIIFDRDYDGRMRGEKTTAGPWEV